MAINSPLRLLAGCARSPFSAVAGLSRPAALGYFVCVAFASQTFLVQIQPSCHSAAVFRGVFKQVKRPSGTLLQHIKIPRQENYGKYDTQSSKLTDCARANLTCGTRHKIRITIIFSISMWVLSSPLR